MTAEKTYDEWQAAGRRVHKGQKAVSFKDGKPVFRITQTYQPANWLATSSRLGVTGPWDDQPH